MIACSCSSVNWLALRKEKRRESAISMDTIQQKHNKKNLQLNGVCNATIVSVPRNNTENLGISCKMCFCEKLKMVIALPEFMRHIHAIVERKCNQTVRWFTINNPQDLFSSGNYSCGQNLHVSAEPIQTTWVKQPLRFLFTTASTWLKGANFFATVIFYFISTYQVELFSAVSFRAMLSTVPPHHHFLLTARPWGMSASTQAESPVCVVFVHARMCEVIRASSLP